MKGVYLDRRTGRYRVYIKVNKRQIWLGATASLDEAQALYRAAALKFFGSFARVG